MQTELFQAMTRIREFGKSANSTLPTPKFWREISAKSGLEEKFPTSRLIQVVIIIFS